VSRECKKLQLRCRKPLFAKPKWYVLLTNAPVSAPVRGAIEQTVAQVLPECRITTQGADDLCALLDDRPTIRTAFPQLLGLRDLREPLSSVVAKSVVERSTLSIERAAELSRVFAPTEAYTESLQTLGKYSFIVLTGPPEMGKTTIGRIVALAKLGEGWESYECRKPDDFFQLYRRSARQVFLADDAFGTTEFRPDLAQAWGDDLDGILRRLDRTHWFICTSRPAPLKIALERIRLQGEAETFPKPGEAVVDAEKLSDREKALIVYRQAKAAGLEKAAREIVKEHDAVIVYAHHFTPERVHRFVTTRLASLAESLVARPSGQVPIRQAVKREIAEPTEAMRKSFQALSQEHQTFLVAMLDCSSARPTNTAPIKPGWHGRLARGTTRRPHQHRRGLHPAYR
jgi:hypothetical protein